MPQTAAESLRIYGNKMAASSTADLWSADLLSLQGLDPTVKKAGKMTDQSRFCGSRRLASCKQALAS